MSDETERNWEIEPADRSRNRPARDGADSRPRPANRSDSRPETATDSAPSHRGSETLADAVSRSATRPTTAEADSFAATLVGVPRIDIQEFVYAHQLDTSHEREGPRPVALFDIENRTDRPLRWRSARTKFIGTDEYTYQPARISLEPSQLGPGCHTRQVEIEPGSKARMVTLVERLPDGVEIAKVIQTVPRQGARSNERLVFPVG